MPCGASGFEQRVFRILPLACLATAGLAGLAFGPGWSARWAPVPWIVSLLVVGLPHGAADLAVTQRLCRRTARLGRGNAAVARVFAVYVAVMATVLALLAFAPVALVLLFACLSIWHFGMSHADCQSPAVTAAWRPRLVAALARGAAVLGVPLAVWPAETAAIVTRILALVDAGPTAADWFAPAGVRAAGCVLVGAGLAAWALEAIASRVPWRLRICLTIARPRPVPCLSRLDETFTR